MFERIILPIILESNGNRWWLDTKLNNICLSCVMQLPGNCCIVLPQLCKYVPSSVIIFIVHESKHNPSVLPTHIWQVQKLQISMQQVRTSNPFNNNIPPRTFGMIIQHFSRVTQQITYILTLSGFGAVVPEWMKIQRPSTTAFSDNSFCNGFTIM